MSETPEKYQSVEGALPAIACRVPSVGDLLIKMGSQVLVKEGEVAVLRVGDAVADVLEPGTHVLSTRTIPLATRSLGLPYGSGTPFEGVFYFLKPACHLTRRWGTPRPVAFLDNMFGTARVRAHGTITVEITNPRVFLRTSGDFAVAAGLRGKLSELIASRFTDALADRVDTLIDLQRYQKDLREMLRLRLEDDLALRGMYLVAFDIEAMTLPREVMATIESRGSVGSVRQLRDFMRAETTEALESVVSQDGVVDDGGEARLLDGGRESERSSRCPACHALLPDDADFCVRCGQPMETLNPCLICSAQNLLVATYCHQCGTTIGKDLTCGECSSPLPPGARYCRECGNPIKATAGGPRG